MKKENLMAKSASLAYQVMMAEKELKELTERNMAAESYAAMESLDNSIIYKQEQIDALKAEHVRVTDMLLSLN